MQNQCITSALYGQYMYSASAAADIAGRDAAKVATASMMSITGFAARPGTAVLPTCSIGPTTQGLRMRSRACLSTSNMIGHEESCGDMTISDDSSRELFVGITVCWVKRPNTLLGSRPTSCRIKMRPWAHELEGVRQTSAGLGSQPWVGTGSRLYITPWVHRCENGPCVSLHRSITKKALMSLRDTR